MSKKRFVARTDAKHGVIQRDVTAAYEQEMFKRYGYKWKQKLRQLAESLSTPEPKDIKPVDPQI